MMNDQSIATLAPIEETVRVVENSHVFRFVIAVLLFAAATLVEGVSSVTGTELKRTETVYPKQK